MSEAARVQAAQLCEQLRRDFDSLQTDQGRQFLLAALEDLVCQLRQENPAPPVNNEE